MIKSALGLLLFAQIISCSSFNKSLHKKESSVNAIQIHTEDIPRFWKAFDESKNKDEVEQIKIFNELYFSPGSKGLKDFYDLRIEDTKSLVQNINQVRPYYEAIRPFTLQIESYLPNINKHFENFKELYPAATHVHVYFLIGKLMTAGTISDNSVLIGLELFGNGIGINEKLIPKHIKIFANNPQKLPEVIVHEIIHTQQSNGDLETLLEQSINEGCADFITELVMGTHPYKDLYIYGYENEANLWRNFKKKMDTSNASEFLYNVSSTKHPDLGYFIGYRITEAYYNKAEDKKKAVEILLTTKDLNIIYKQSAYSPK